MHTSTCIHSYPIFRFKVIKNEDQVLKEEEKEADEKADSERTRAMHTYSWVSTFIEIFVL
jgi:hypothetical protein